MGKRVITIFALLLLLYCSACEYMKNTTSIPATRTHFETRETEIPSIQSTRKAPVETTETPIIPLTESTPVEMAETPEVDQEPAFVGPVAHFSVGEVGFPFMAIAPHGEWRQDSSDESIEDVVRTASDNGFTVIEFGFQFGESNPEQRLVFDKFVYFASIYNMRVIVGLFHGEDYETRKMIEGDQEALNETLANIRKSLRYANSITGIPYREDPTIMAWGFRDIGSLIMEATGWRKSDEAAYSPTGAEVRDLLEALAQEVRANAPNQLVFASVSTFFTGRDDIYDFELEQPGWLTMQDAPSVDFWYWYVDSKADYWWYRYTSPNDFLVGSVPFSKPFAAVLDPYLSHEFHVEAGVYTFDTLCTDDEWRASQLRKASQFLMDEVGVAGLGIFQWSTDLQWDILTEIDRCFAITSKNSLITQVFREYAAKLGWNPTTEWDQDTFVTVVYDADPSLIPRRAWSESDYVNRTTHIFTYRTIYEQLVSAALHDAEAIIQDEADLDSIKSRLAFWLQTWEDTYLRIPDTKFSAAHRELQLAVMEILNGVSLLESGDSELALRRIGETVDRIERVSAEFELMLDQP